jgi:nitronate monooxygenase
VISRALRTPLTDLLGVDLPIVQSGMGAIAGAELAAAVSEAGGLGIVGSAGLTPDALREAIRAVRARTGRPFGVNLLMPDELRPPLPASAVSAADVARVHAVLAPMRRHLGLSPDAERPHPPPHWIPAYLDIVLEETVPVLSVGLGNPGAEIVARCRARGIRTLAMVTTVEDARAVEAAGIDAVVAQGGEAGGHRSHFRKPASSSTGSIGTLTLVPQVVDAVSVPVIAAGGIADGRGLVASLALGAAGVLVGTRFVATREAAAAASYKAALVAREADASILTDAWTGRYARALRNRFTDAFAGVEPLAPFWQLMAAADVVQEATRRDDPELLPLWAGQSAGLVRDLPGAGEAVASMAREAEALIMAMAQAPQSP